MGPKTIELCKTVESIIDQLQFVEEMEWAKQLSICLAQIRNSDINGIDRLYRLFGGMGSLNDLVIHPMNKHKISNDKVNEVNMELRSSLTKVYQLLNLIRAEQ